MCLFRGGGGSAMPIPAPIQPRQPDMVRASRLPRKKELTDPDDLAGVEYGTTAKAKTKGAGQKTGTDALKIPVNTGGTPTGSNTGGMNVSG
tara:strand:+ start:201 stop:473 length:273 start_codon:yes stop_codon:yes gene_type:complete